VSSQSKSRTTSSLAAAAGVEIELQRQRLPHRDGRGLDRGLGQHRAPEIGVQHGAGEIEDGPEARRGVGI
jgi:hypothetical protein